jgi:Zn ribbon nucleic-acid-binding protein
MTPSDCLTRICGSPDVSCPACGKTMAIWVKDDLPIYRCNECNGIAFPLDNTMLEKAMKNTKDKAVSEMSCSGCGQSLIEIRSEEYRMDSCEGCSMIFVRPKGEFWGNEPDITQGNYNTVLSWLSEVYEDVSGSL